jgi:ABC-type antimicrobial peptide transport system permease subunit
MSVLERTCEFGMLLALGMRPGLVGLMVWLEFIFLAFAGAALGIGVGGPVTLWFVHAGISYPGLQTVLTQFGLPGRLYPLFDAQTAFAGPGAIVLAICLAGIVPYVHIRGLDAANAMRAA